MNKRLVIWCAGNVLSAAAVVMVFPLAIALFYGEDFAPLLITMAIGLAVGVPVVLRMRPKERGLQARDGYAVVAATWLIIAAYGSLPYFFSGLFDGWLDCFFDSMACFTTTGASVLTDVESFPRGLMLWRGLSYWFGGMGVLVLMLAVAGQLGASGFNLFQAETTGPSSGRIVPRMRDTAKILYLIYLAMTVLVFIILIVAGLRPFEAVINAFGIASTGGLTTRNGNIGAFGSPLVEVIVTIFTVLFSINFTTYFFLVKRDWKSLRNNEELRVYAVVFVAAAVIVFFGLTRGGDGGAIGKALFQTASYMSTAGFKTAAIEYWSATARVALILIMTVGGMAGSTAGGIKLARVIILFKLSRNEISKIIHPRVVKSVTLNGKKVTPETQSRVCAFFFIYFAVLALSSLVLSLEGMSLFETFSTALAMLSNVGTGMQLSGRGIEFAEFSPLSKVVLSFCMYAGRLEFYAALLMFMPSMWRKAA